MAAAYILVEVEAGQAQLVLERMRAVDGIRQAHACWGRPDIFAFCEAPDDKTLADTVLNSVHALTGVRHTETHLVVDL